MLKNLGWELKEKQPEEVKIKSNNKATKQTKKQWEAGFKKYKITDPTEQKWMIRNAIELMQKHNVKNCGDAHKIWIESTQKGIN